MIGEITPSHYDQILAMNTRFVHWLSPLNLEGLVHLISEADYARQINDGQGVLIGFSSRTNYDDKYGHKNITWLREKFVNFYYIDRVIIADDSQGKGLARRLYEDLEQMARIEDVSRLVCEVNTKPDNLGSHRFHTRLGFKAIGDVDYPAFDASLRYYEKPLS